MFLRGNSLLKLLDENITIQEHACYTLRLLSQLYLSINFQRKLLL